MNKFPKVINNILGLALRQTFKLKWAKDKVNPYEIKGLFRFDEYGLQRRSRLDDHWYYVDVWTMKIITGEVDMVLNHENRKDD